MDIYTHVHGMQDSMVWCVLHTVMDKGLKSTRLVTPVDHPQSSYVHTGQYLHVSNMPFKHFTHPVSWTQRRGPISVTNGTEA